MTKHVWSHVLASSKVKSCYGLMFWLRVPSQIIHVPDCTRYIIGVFCYNLKITDKHSCFILTLACVKTEIQPMLTNSHFSYIVQNHSGVAMFIQA